MSSTGKAVGGISVLGILAFLLHVLHPIFSIYEYNHPKPTYSIEQSMKNMHQFQMDLDSIRETVSDTILRDSLLEERLHEEMNKIGSSVH